MQTAPDTPQNGIIRQTALSDWYSLLSLLLQRPTKELICSLLQTSPGDDLERIADELGATSSEVKCICMEFDNLSQYLSADEDALGNARREHTRLFRHPKKPAVWPYEGVFADEERLTRGMKSTESRLFVNPAAMDAERCYASMGFKLTSNITPADDIIIELDYVGRLHRKFAEALIKEDHEEQNRVQSALTHFKATHLSNWVPCFFSQCKELSRHPLYRVVGETGRLLMEVEQIGEGSPPSAPDCRSR